MVRMIRPPTECGRVLDSWRGPGVEAGHRRLLHSCPVRAVSPPTRLAQMAKLVEQAQTGKAAVQRLADDRGEQRRTQRRRQHSAGGDGQQVRADVAMGTQRKALLGGGALRVAGSPCAASHWASARSGKYQSGLVVSGVTAATLLVAQLCSSISSSSEKDRLARCTCAPAVPQGQGKR